MKHAFFVINLLFISMLCFSQQNIPRKIIGQIPNSNSTKLYQIQVGAFKVYQNAENTFVRLIEEGFTAVFEEYFDYIRVMITGIPVSQVQSYLTRIKRIGFDEVIIREDTSRHAISEK
jgi:cell division protein FtsN